MKDNFDRAKWLPIILVGAILLFTYYLFGSFGVILTELSRFTGIVAPLLFGILFTYFLYTPHKHLEKLLRRVKIKKFTFISTHARGIGIIIVFIALIALIALVLAFLLPTIFNSITDLVRNVPGYFQSILNYWNNLPADSPLAGFNIGGLLNEYSGTIINTIMNSSGLEQVTQGVVGFAGGIFNVILGIFLSLYILLYREELGEYFRRLNNAIFKNKVRRDKVARYMSSINRVLLTFIASKGLDALTNFAAALVITTIFGVPYALLMGLIMGLFNFIPYIGSIVSTIVISVLALVTNGLPTAIPVAICLLIFQQTDANFIEPRIMKTSLKINPILVIMAVVIGGAYFGVAGMFLGVPVAVIIKQTIDEYISHSETPVVLDDSRR